MRSSLRQALDVKQTPSRTKNARNYLKDLSCNSFWSLLIISLTAENFVETKISHMISLSPRIVVSIFFSSYAFTQCVKKSLSSKVGCKLPWDEQTKGKATVSIRISKYLTSI